MSTFDHIAVRNNFFFYKYSKIIYVLMSVSQKNNNDFSVSDEMWLQIACGVLKKQMLVFRVTLGYLVRTGLKYNLIILSLKL